MKNKRECFTLVLVIIVFAFINYNLIKEIEFMNTYGRSKATSESEKIGTISLYSSPVRYPTISRVTGHSWIYIYNTSKTAFFINDTYVPPNEGITFGTSSSPSLPKKGIWINVEGYNNYLKNEYKNKYSQNISITADFYEEDLEYLENYLAQHNKWNIIYNCSAFATQIWNNVNAGEDLKIRAFTPLTMYSEIKKTQEYELNKEYTVFEYYHPYKEK